MGCFAKGSKIITWCGSRPNNSHSISGFRFGVPKPETQSQVIIVWELHLFFQRVKNQPQIPVLFNPGLAQFNLLIMIEPSPRSVIFQRYG